jgi:hypothetical protein
VSPRGRILGRFAAVGVKPECLVRMKSYGVHLAPSIFNESQEIKEH